MQQNEQQTIMAGDTDITNVGMPLYKIIIMGIGLAFLVAILYRIIAKVYSVIKSPIRVQRNIQPAWRNPEVFRYNSECCPICLSVPSLPLATNCGHVFCGPCLRTVWRNTVQAMLVPYVPCPICRTMLHEILPIDPQDMLYSTLMRPPPGPNNNTSCLTLYDFVVMFNETYKCLAALQPPLKRPGRAITWGLVFRSCFQHPVVGLLLGMIIPALCMSELNNIIDNAQPWGFVDDVLVVAVFTMPLVNYLIRDLITLYELRRRRPQE